MRISMTLILLNYKQFIFTPLLHHLYSLAYGLFRKSMTRSMIRSYHSLDTVLRTVLPQSYHSLAYSISQVYDIILRQSWYSLAYSISQVYDIILRQSWYSLVYSLFRKSNHKSLEQSWYSLDTVLPQSCVQFYHNSLLILHTWYIITFWVS